MYSLINKVKEINPLILHYTNEVTINDCANITLALGASPLMSYSLEEVEEIVCICNSVIINIGTVNSSHIELFIKAAKVANKLNKPIILDPVGVFATKTRQYLVEKLLSEAKFDVIKGNVSEMKFIGGFNVKGKGVDSLDDYQEDEIIKNISNKLNCVVVSTGKVDILSDGKRIIKINNGTPKLKSITGTGCMSNSLIGSFIAVTEDKLEGSAMGILTMGVCGELADINNLPIGSFKVKLMDNVYELTEEKLRKYSRIEVS